ncbi:MAG: ATP-binding cassette domain-containing protein [Candidatus Dojkabacteria bacterium]
MKNALTVKNLKKEYKGFVAVDGISFNVREGEIFGILGPNGAGKTTTLEMLEGLRPITSGKAEILGIKINGKNRKALQERIGVQLQSSSYFDLLTLLEILDLFGSFYSKRIDSMKLLKMVKLEQKKDSLVKDLSGGQAQRFSIVASIVNDPDLVFLDEPTTGLDPQIRRALWELIREINKEGKTIIMTTHYMEEAEELCDRVAIMDGGKIIALDSPQKMIIDQNLLFTIKFSTAADMTDKQIEEFKKNELVSKFWEEKQKYVFRIEDPTKINDILNWLEKHKLQFRNLEILPPNMEDVFLKLTGKSLRE